MNFVINTKTFEKLLSNALTVAPSHSPVEIIQNVKLSVKDKILTLSATDSQVYIETKTEVDTNTDFELVFPGRILHDTIRAIDETEIKFEVVDNKKFKLITNTGNYMVSFFETNLFPLAPTLKNPVSFNINGKKLRKAFESTVFAASKEDAKLSMTGVLIDIVEDEIRFVATDAHRLMKFAITDVKNEINKKVVVPARTVNILLKFLSEQDLEVSFDNSYIKIQDDNVTFYSRLVEESYPNYETVIPIENNLILEVDRVSLLKALKRILGYTSSSNKLVRFSIKKDEMTVFAENIDLGYNALEKILCDFNDNQMDIAFNCNFINEIILSLDCEKVVFKMYNSTKACLIEPAVQKEDESILALVMPLRINI